MKKLIILFISLFLLSSSFGSENENDISWLEGHWVGNGFNGICEESWMPMSGGTMCGTFKLLVNDKIVFYELMTIVPIDSSDGYNMRLKHFNPDMTGWEEKDQVMQFNFVSMDEKSIFFDGLTYELISEDSLLIKVRVSHKDQTESFVEIRCGKN